MAAAVHHIDLNVSDLERSCRFYGTLLDRLGYQPFARGIGWESWVGDGSYLTLVQTAAPYLSRGFHRKGVGVNHIAFQAGSREEVDRFHEWLLEREIPVLYGGPLDMGRDGTPNYAVFFEDPDRLKLELVYRPLAPVGSERRG